MVRKISKFFAYFAFFVLALMYFTPKESIYYLGEDELKKFGVVISGESVKDKGLSLEIKDASLSVEAIESAKVETLDITLLFLFNSVHVQNITLSSMAANFIPVHIQDISISYNIFDPLHINAKAVGEFGEAKARVSLLDRKASLKLKASKKMQRSYSQTLNMLKRDKEGGYRYEQSF